MKKLWYTVVFVALAALIVSDAAAQRRIPLMVQVISASRAERGIDPSLGKLRRQLRSFFNYSSYRLIGKQRLFLAPGQTGRMELPGGATPTRRERRFGGRFFSGPSGGRRSLEVTAQGWEGRYLRLQVSVKEGRRHILNTQFRIARGGTVMIGGPPFGSGVLIIALTAGP